MTTTTTRPLYEIAREVRQNWNFKTSGTQLDYGAVPYLDAMSSLDKITDNYGCDSAKSIVLYFLCNASTWRGAVAKRVKSELRAMTSVKKYSRV